MQIYAVPSQGYLLESSPKAINNAKYIHYFCGLNKDKQAICPNCKSPLYRILSLDTSDPRLQLENAPFKYLTLLWCWKCILSYSKIFSYVIAKDGNISIWQYNKHKDISADFPYKDYPLFFPEVQIELIPVSEQLQELIEKVNDNEVSQSKARTENGQIIKPNNQIGGEPYLLHPIMKYLRCKLCNKRMPLFASIGDENTNSKGFADYEYQQTLFFYCRNCYVVSAFNQCD